MDRGREADQDLAVRDRNGHGRFGTWADTKAGLAAKVEQWYRRGWRELTVVTGDGPVPPREDEELQVAGIGRRPGERRRVCWYEAPGRPHAAPTAAMR